MIKDIGIIGAGPNGLVCAKIFNNFGFNTKIFEQLDNFGGMWRYNPNPNSFSPCYESLTTNTPKRLTAFQDLPMPDSYPTYPHHSHMISYLENYVKMFNLSPLISLNSLVLNIRYNNNKWKVEYELSSNNNKKLIIEEFDAIAICTGHHWKEKPLEFKNRNIFKGDVIHSCHYRKASQWKDKRIIIQGLGVSGREILQDILPFAKNIIACSSRNEIELSDDILNKITIHKPIKQFIGESSVEFLDGSKEDNIDAVIYSSGYQIYLPFFNNNEYFLLENNNIINLYQRIISPQYPTLGFIGFVTTYGSLHPISEVQSRYFASILSKNSILPSLDIMNKEIKQWRSQLQDYRPMNVDYWDYIGQITKLLPKVSYRKPRKKLTLNIPSIESVSSIPLKVKVASIQASSILGDVEGNIKKFTKLIKEAASNNAKFIVLPEAAIPGYVSQDLKTSWHIPGRKLAISPIENISGDMNANQQQFLPKDNLEQIAECIPGPSTDYFCKLAKQVQAYLVIPLIEKVKRKTNINADASFFKPHPWIFYNSCVLISPEGFIVGHYRKNNLWGCVDNGWCTAGTDTCIYDTEYGRVGLAICFDVHIMYKRYKSENIWTLLYPIAWVDRDIETWFTIDLPQRIAENGFNVIGSNWSIDNPDIGKTWKGYGYSSIYSKDGSILASAKTLYGSEIIYAELPTNPISNNNNNNNNIKTSSDYSTDLLSLHGEPSWTRRSKTTEERFSKDFKLKIKKKDKSIIECIFKQGGDAEHLGMTVWDGGIILGKYFEYLLENNKISFDNTKIIELGSGTGILGIILSCLGADVIFSDLNDSSLLKLLQSNISMNQKYFPGKSHIIPIDWCSTDLPNTLPNDIYTIVAADVIYSSDLVQPLINTMDKLCNDYCTIYISYEMHHLESVKQFFKEAKQIFSIEHISSNELHPDYQCGGIGVKRMRKYTFKERISNQLSNEQSNITQLLQLQQERKQLMNKIMDIDIKIDNILKSITPQVTPKVSNKPNREEEQVKENISIDQLQEQITERPTIDELIEKQIAYECKCEPKCALLCRHISQ